MKNFTTILGAVVLTLPLAAQVTSFRNNLPEAMPKVISSDGPFNSSHASANSRAAGDVISGYSWDFADTIPDGWTAVDVSGNGPWVWSNQAPQGQFSTNIPRIQSTTGANGFMILDGDFYNEGPVAGTPTEDPMDAYFQTPNLDFTGFDDVLLTFQSSVRFCCNGTTISMLVQVSNDGTNWFDFDFRDDLPVNSTSTDPKDNAINISAIAGNQANVQVRFHVSGATHYFWMIDDVAFVESEENNLIVRNVFADYLFEGGGKYTRIPYGQVGPMTFRAIVENQGSVDQTNVTFNTTVTQAGTEVFNESAVDASFPRATIDTIVSVPFTIDNVAGSKGLYTASFDLTQDQTDVTPADNTFPNASFTVTDTVFARDNNAPLSTNKMSVGNYEGGDIDGSRLTNLFECTKGGIMSSVSVFLATDATAVGTTFKGIVYQATDAAFVPILETDFYDITAPNQMNRWVTLPFLTDGSAEIIPEEGADYIVGIEVYGVTADKNVYLAEDEATLQPNQTTYIFVSDDWFYVNNLPFIRFNLVDPEVGIEDVNAPSVNLSQNIPNPANTFSLINYMLDKPSTVTLTITDISGKAVQVISQGTKSQGKHQINVNTSELSSGTYFYTLNTEIGSQTKRMMIVR